MTSNPTSEQKTVPEFLIKALAEANGVCSACYCARRNEVMR